MLRQLFARLPKPSGSYAGKTVIVTGSNSGLGFEAAQHFTRLGASRVILAVRSIQKGEEAKKSIEKTTGVKNVLEVWRLDMSSYESVLDFAARAEKELERLDIALLNAGIAPAKFEILEQDESTITVNVVSTFLLALALLPKLKQTSAKFNIRPNLTIVSSIVHYWTQFKEKDVPEGEIFAKLKQPTADLNERYFVSKLMEVFVVRAWADRKPLSQIPVTINTVHPGYCKS